MKRLLTIIFLFAAIVTLQAQTVHLTHTYLTAEPGQYHFDRPRAVVYDGDENVTSQFYLNYFIKGQENDTTVYENKIVTQNPVTGTRVSMLYGIVTIGSNAGDDTIRVVARPRSGSGYSQCEASYIIHIPKIQPHAILSQDSIHVHTSQLFGFPTARLWHVNGTDSTNVTSYYDVSYSHSSGLKEYWSNFVGSYGTNVLQAPDTETDTLTITMTYTPKDDYADIYEAYTKVYHVTMYTWTGDTMPTHLEWPDGKTISGQNNTSVSVVMPVVRDIYGNDVSRLMTYDYSPQHIDKMINSMWSSNNGAYGSWILLFGYQVTGSTKISMTAQQANDSKSVDPVVYAAVSDSMIVSQYKALWTFTVTPSTFQLYKDNLVLDRSNWKVPTFNVRDSQGKTQEYGFQRRVAFPVGTYSGWDNGSSTGDTITYRGIKYAVRVAESYAFPSEYGTWKIDYTDIYDTLVAHNAPFMLFTIAVNNSGQEDVADYYTNYTIDVRDEIATHIDLSATTVSANIINNELKGFNNPTATVRDANEVNVDSAFNMTYDIVADSSTVAADFSINDTTGVLTYNSTASGKEGSVYIRVSAARKSASAGYTDPQPVHYIVYVKPTDFDYEVITDAMASTSKADSAHLGKFHFTAAGYMAAGTVIDDMAGISIQFGTTGDSDWRLIKADSIAHPDQEGTVKGHGIVYTEGAPVELNDNEIPIAGTFAILRPTVNGFLTIDGRWAKNNHYRLICVSNGSITQTIDYMRTDTVHIGEQWMNQALIAGQTYYLFNYGADDGTNEPSLLHGFNFDPAYILTTDSHMAVTHSTTFVNGYTGGVAYMVTEATDNVSFQTVKVPGTKSGVNLADYLTLNTQTGAVTPLKSTAGITDSTAAVRNRIIIRATVTNSDKTVTRLTDLYLYISDIPSYIIRNGQTPSVGERVTTTNIRTNITMTFGGWENGSGPYVYRSRSLYDSWEPAKTDTVGQNEMTIDGFIYASQGANDARDENLSSFNGNRTTHTPWELPCRGTYLTFEPEENGTLIVYLLQNGILDYTGSRQWSDLLGSGTNYVLKYRPLYILDEAAHNVTLDNSWIMDPSLLASNSTQMTNAGSYTEGLYRSTWDDDWVRTQLENNGHTTNNSQLDSLGFSNCPYDMYTNYHSRTADLKAIMAQWQKYTSYDDTEHARQEIIHLATGGYTIVSKAFVRYTFQVKAGKTYYVFMRGSKLSPCGFSFVPTGWEPDDTANVQDAHELTLDDTADFAKTYSNVASTEKTNGELRNTNVTLNRQFGRNKWTSICLPFSVSETKFKAFFGDDASVITYDSIGSDGTGYFTQHVVHSIVANRPYFICPSQDIASGSIINNVTIESGFGAMTVNDTQKEYAAIGTFAPTTAPAQSYVFAGTDIYHLKTATALNSYRAYIAPLSADAKPMLSMSVASKNAADSPVTGIETIRYDGGNSSNDGKAQFLNGVYNLAGQKIADALSPTLPAGVYIVNGRKVVHTPL